MNGTIIRASAAALLAVSTAAVAETAAVARLVDAAGNDAGTVRFTPGPTGVLLEVDARGMVPGPHAIHLHSVGSCSPDFGHAKGHINPDGREHGLLNPNGPDRGDLPNIFAAADGTVRAELFTTLVSIEGGDAALFDADGSAVVVHQNPDDHVTQPIGGAGPRIACGVVERP